MSPVFQILIVGLGTYAIRVSAIALAGRLPEPTPATQATMRLIGPAVLAAIVADRLFLREGSPSVNWSWWLAAAIAAGIAHRWRSAGATMGIGMLAVWTLNASGLS